MIVSAGRLSPGSVVVAILLSVSVGAREPAVAQRGRIDVTAVLDTYLQGRPNEAVAPLRRATPDQARDFRHQLVLQGIPWVDSVASDRSRRALAAAALALEITAIRAEADEWAADDRKDCAGRCVIEWACTLLASRGAPDDAERIWMLASIALVGGVRDWTFLQIPYSPQLDRIDQGHVHHALARFPDEPRFRLARAIALRPRYLVTAERDLPGSNDRPMPRSVIGPRFLDAYVNRDLKAAHEYAKRELEALTQDAVLSAEARIRLGYLHWVDGAESEALAQERAAASTATEPDLKYLAHFLAAQAAQALGDLPAAETHYRAALAARPYSQSATLGLSALLYARGEGEQAYELVEASLSNLPRDDDPWRMFLYGDFRRLLTLVAELRRKLAL